VSIRAVVVDVGGVLERVDDASWPQILIDRWEQRAGRPAGVILAALAEHAPGDAIATGRISEQQFTGLYADTLGLDPATTAQLMTEMWDAYCGELDVAEVGLAKHDPAIFEVTEQRLAVAADEIVFIDDVPSNVDAACRRGWHAIHHTDTRDTITQVTALLASDATV
jgi:FMN phosphatase YigB (HAD superfamily)